MRDGTDRRRKKTKKQQLEVDLERKTNRRQIDEENERMVMRLEEGERRIEWESNELNQATREKISNETLERKKETEAGTGMGMGMEMGMETNGKRQNQSNRKKRKTTKQGGNQQAIITRTGTTNERNERRGNQR